MAVAFFLFAEMFFAESTAEMRKVIYCCMRLLAGGMPVRLKRQIWPACKNLFF